MRIYVEGMESMIDDEKELQMLLEKNPLKENDFRSFSKKLFNINTLEEACKILQILLNGSTVIFDNHHQKYTGYSNAIDFRNINGLPNVLQYFSDQNVYKTFIIK